MTDDTNGILPETRWTLMSKLASGQRLDVDETEWVHRYLSVIQSLKIMRLRQETSGDAEDVANAVMGRVIDRFQKGEFDPGCDSLRPYIVGCLQNEISSRHRNEAAAKRIPLEKLDSRDRLESSDKVCEDGGGDSEKYDHKNDVQLSDDIVRKFTRFSREECLKQCGGFHAETKEIIRYYIFGEHTSEETAAHFGKTKAYVADVKRRFADFFEYVWAPQQELKYKNHPSLIVRELYRYCKDTGFFMIR